MVRSDLIVLLTVSMSMDILCPWGPDGQGFFALFTSRYALPISESSIWSSNENLGACDRLWPPVELVELAPGISELCGQENLAGRPYRRADGCSNPATWLLWSPVPLCWPVEE